MHTRSEKELERIGFRYAGRFRRLGTQHHAKEATVLALVGELGAGKTTFLRGFARGLGIRKRVTSPTFVLARRYKIPPRTMRRNAVGYNAKISSDATAYSLRPTADYKWFWHFDCYRLHSVHDLEELGFREIIRDPHALVAIEWADRIKNALRKKTAWIEFSHHPKGRRVVIRRISNF